MKIDAPYINRSFGGSSMDRIVRTSIIDLLDIKKKNKNLLVAIIGVTDSNRIEVGSFRPSTTRDLKKNYWTTVSVSVPKLGSELQSLLKYKTRFETPYHELTNYYKNVILLQDFCKVNEITLFWVETCMNYALEWENRKRFFEKVRPDLVVLRDYATQNFIMKMHELVIGKLNVFTPGGHYTKEMHDIFANYMVDMLNEHCEKI